MNNYPELTLKLLANRGITTNEDIKKFLSPSYEEDLHDPFLIKGMEKAVVRIFEAIEGNEKIIIYTDYDCDGIPGSVVFYDFFKKINYYNFDIYIPDRHKEGYGLNKEAIKKFSNKKVKLIITVDLGINNVNEVAQAEALGIDVIITDHHLPPKNLPRAYSIINSKQLDDKYPFKELCGAGVAFKVIQGFIQKYKEYFDINNGWEKWLLDMVGIATLSDRVVLRGENRVLAYFGLKVLQKNKRIGLQQLFKKANINSYFASEDDISFTIAPRLNAASRMDHPQKALELLIVNNEIEGKVVSDYLTNINNERKIIVAQIMREINKNIQHREKNELIVVGNPKWRIGVLGLVATRLVEQYQKPIFVWGVEGGEIIKGSCRSDGSVNLVELMRKIPKQILIDYGGHEMAGGFSVVHEKIHFLEDELVKAYNVIKKAENEIINKDIFIDKEMSLKEVIMENYSQIERLAPFGEGNPKPIFMFRDLKIEEIRIFGKNKNHLELLLMDDNKDKIKAISFFSNAESFKIPLEDGKKINLVANFELSRWNGNADLRLRVVDII